MDERSEDIEYSDLLGNMPCESGYYWLYITDWINEVVYLWADDMDAGSRYCRFFNGMEIREGDGRLKESKWVYIQNPFLPNNKECRAERR
ncbi:MAG: hypothetical protein HRU12_01090 [Phaeodactylibacter sp.]|nr:hypothetical protein [Phaeodactylibacter sp.]